MILFIHRYFKCYKQILFVLIISTCYRTTLFEGWSRTSNVSAQFGALRRNNIFLDLIHKQDQDLTYINHTFKGNLAVKHVMLSNNYYIIVPLSTLNGFIVISKFVNKISWFAFSLATSVEEKSYRYVFKKVLLKWLF